jgi:hypothetical protein
LEKRLALVGFPDGLRMRAPSATRLASLVYGFPEGLAHQAARQDSRVFDSTKDLRSINKYIEINIMEVSLQTIYDNLEKIDRVDTITSAMYRQSAQEVLADPEISLEWRKAISDRLNQVNHELTVHSVVDDDSY